MPKLISRTLGVAIAQGEETVEQVFGWRFNLGWVKLSSSFVFNELPGQTSQKMEVGEREREREALGQTFESYYRLSPTV